MLDPHHVAMLLIDQFACCCLAKQPVATADLYLTQH